MTQRMDSVNQHHSTLRPSPPPSPPGTGEREDVSLAILAGGRGSRMGVAKDRITVAGEPVLKHLLTQLHFAGPTILVASPEHPQPIGYAAFDRVVQDEQVGAGPLAGILAALAGIDTKSVCILSIDMPHIAAPQIDWLIATAAAHPQANGFLCRRRDERGSPCVEPFPCLLRKESAETIRAHFSKGGRSVRSLLDLPGILAVDVPEQWPSSLWLNLNFPDDLRKIGAKLG